MLSANFYVLHCTTFVKSCVKDGLWHVTQIIYKFLKGKLAVYMIFLTITSVLHPVNF